VAHPTYNSFPNLQKSNSADTHKNIQRTTQTTLLTPKEKGAIGAFFFIRDFQKSQQLSLTHHACCAQHQLLGG
jgi:hypothetical protein